MQSAAEICLRALGATAGAVIAAWAGYRIAKVPGRWWFFGWAVPLLTLYLAAVGMNVRQYYFVAPFSWVVGGWRIWIVVGWAAAMTLGTLVVKLPRASTRRIVWALCGVIVLRATTLPFISPLISNPTQRTLKTMEDGHGVCLQSTSYNCGPASAVTALRKLGFKAEEGELGLLCSTSVMNGTPDDLLVEALRKKYGPQGLKVEWRYVKSVDELRAWPVSLAVIKYSMFVDHYVTVLGFEGDKMVIGDPLSGIERQTTEAFLETWHHVAIMMRRE